MVWDGMGWDGMGWDDSSVNYRYRATVAAPGCREGTGGPVIWKARTLLASRPRDARLGPTIVTPQTGELLQRRGAGRNGEVRRMEGVHAVIGRERDAPLGLTLVCVRKGVIATPGNREGT